MSRTTQYIGLNRYAINFVKDAIKTEQIKITEGMLNETVVGTVYYMEPPFGPNKEYKFIETVQVIPWSSGPMIFTCLEMFLTKECGQILECGKCFEWMYDPGLKCEYDEETGRYNV